MDSDALVRIALISLFPSQKFNLIGESHGICCISGYLNATYGSQVQVKLFDQQINSNDYIIEKLISFKPHIIGYSIKMGTFPQFEELYSQIIDKYHDNIYSIVGNSFAHFNSEYILDRYPELIISIGEGELTFEDIVSHISGKLCKQNVRNIIYYDNGKICTSPQKYLESNKIPIADRRYTKIFYEKGGEIYIEGSRGCGYCSCSICECRYFLGSIDSCLKWRGKSILKVVDELQLLSNNNIKEVTFSDEDFFGFDNGDFTRLEELVDYIKQRELKINYRVNARVKSILNCLKVKNNLVSRLKDSGLVKIFLGFESGSVSQLKRYSKGFSLYDFMNVVRELNYLSIDYELGFIPFDPLMTFDELCETFNFIEVHNLVSKVSSVIKELRIQGGNQDYLKRIRDFEARNFLQLLTSYDYNTQLYPIIRYADSQVNRIIKLLRDYNVEKYSDYYTLRIQTQYINNDKYQNTIKKLKANDFNLIKKLISLVSVFSSDKELRDTIEKYKYYRNLIYNESCQE